MNYKYFKISEHRLINILLFITSLLLFLKFFIYADFYPVHDEVAIIERNTEWQNFLWRNNTSNHTLNSFFAVIIKEIFGYNLLFYRFVSFLSFVGILFIFKKIYPNLILFSFFILLILSSSILTNYTWIFRGYYTWAFLTALNFYYIKLFIYNFNDNKKFKILLFINLLLSCHALFTLYTVFPTLLLMAYLVFKKTRY